MRAVNAMVIDFKPTGEPCTRADFSYHITPATISITGKGRLLSVGNRPRDTRQTYFEALEQLRDHLSCWGLLSTRWNIL
jgi:hypothetical protein